MNSVQIMGRITKDLELRIVRNDLAVLSFSIAYNERRNDRDEVNFFDITAFGRQAENISKFFKKGQRILLQGRLRHERFNDKEGNPRSKVSIILNEFDFVEPKDSGSGDYGGGDYKRPSEKAPQSNEGMSSFSDAPTDIDDEVPF